MKRSCKICKQPAKYVTALGHGNCGDVECGKEIAKLHEIEKLERQLWHLQQDTKNTETVRPNTTA